MTTTMIVGKICEKKKKKKKRGRRRNQNRCVVSNWTLDVDVLIDVSIAWNFPNVRRSSTFLRDDFRDCCKLRRLYAPFSDAFSNSCETYLRKSSGFVCNAISGTVVVLAIFYKVIFETSTKRKFFSRSTASATLSDNRAWWEYFIDFIWYNIRDDRSTAWWEFFSFFEYFRVFL